ncbi:hypothetical protein GCM10011500_09790 [Mucilaginibacter rubeus]|nr:hypothetical protein GCM10011500_09790 [Mucilaginibacter rubeus]
MDYENHKRSENNYYNVALNPGFDPASTDEQDECQTGYQYASQGGHSPLKHSVSDIY